MPGSMNRSTSHAERLLRFLVVHDDEDEHEGPVENQANRADHSPYE